MDRNLICQICGAKFSFNPVCTCLLGEHLIKKHPGSEMTHFVVDNLPVCECDNESRSGSGRDMSVPALGKNGNANKNGIFKTTIETWKPGPIKVTCPSCGKEDRPCIRKERNKVAYSQLGAICMVTCWPICFLPCLMPQASAIHLYCKHCGTFLGNYNRQTGLLNSSPVDENKKLNVPSNLC